MKNTISVVITAAGDSFRFGENKMMALINGKPVLFYTLRQFQQVKAINEIIVVANKKNILEYRKIIKKFGFNAKITLGGPERIISVYNGIKASKGEYIITHDGNRPLTPAWLINKLIEKTIKYQAAMTAIPPTATVKYSNGFIIKKSLPRSKTWIAQTPQGFKREIILQALEKAIRDKYFIPTDDSELVTRLGKRVFIVPGDEINVKITYPQDLITVKQLLKLSKNK